MQERLVKWRDYIAPKTIPYSLYSAASVSQPGAIEWGHSFGWRQNFADLDDLSKARFEDNDPANAWFQGVVAGLRIFEKALSQTYSRADLAAKSEIFRNFPDSVKRDDLRFFFNVAPGREGTVIVTAFLQPTIDEIAARPTNYAATNKHLHHAFLSSNGVIRKVPQAFKRDRYLADMTEHTAYAQFYIRPFSSKRIEKGISILIHPLQRARLGYNYHLDPQAKRYKEAMHSFYRRFVGLGQKLAHLGQGSAVVAPLQAAGRGIYALSKQIAQTDFEPENSALVDELWATAATLPEKIEINGQSICARNLLRRAIRYSLQIHRMISKQKTNHEANYTAADEITGAQRELVFLAVSDILRGAMIEATELPTFRFLLSPDQIDKIPLSVRARDVAVRAHLESEIRRKIKSVAEKVSGFCRKDVGLFFLEKPSAHGQFLENYRADLWQREEVEFIALDSDHG